MRDAPSGLLEQRGPHTQPNSLLQAKQKRGSRIGSPSSTQSGKVSQKSTYRRYLVPSPSDLPLFCVP